jgi:hypothetical protein
MVAGITTYIITMRITHLFVMGGTFCPHFIQCKLQYVELYFRSQQNPLKLTLLQSNQT